METHESVGDFLPLLVFNIKWPFTLCDQLINSCETGDNVDVNTTDTF